MSEVADRLIKAGQEEARTRPRLRGNNQNPRQVELRKELDLDTIRKARADFDAGKISLEEFNRIAGRK